MKKLLIVAGLSAPFLPGRCTGHVHISKEKAVAIAPQAAAISKTVLNAPDVNKTIVLRFVNEVINKKRFDLIDELWAENMVWYGGSAGEVHGIEAYKKMLTESVGSSFTDMFLQVKDIIASGDKVALYFSNSGKNVGDFMGNKATYKTAVWDGMGIYRIENGKIAEAWFSEDHLTMFRQLGFIKQ